MTRTGSPLLPICLTRTWVLFVRFGVVGLLNTAFGYVTFALLVLAGMWPGAALVAANIAGVAFNFQTSRRLVFRAAGHRLRFVILYCVMLALNWVALRIALRLGVSALPAQALLVLPIAAVSFLGQRIFVFNPALENP